MFDILGEPADTFSDAAYQGRIRPLHDKLSFREACRSMRRIAAQTIAMATIHQKPWGIQVAGNFNRAVAIRQWQRIAPRIHRVAPEAEPVVSRVRSARGRRGIYAVRIGAENRKEADAVCRQLRSGGGSCGVLRNR